VNPNLIKQDIDGVEYSNAAPPIGSTLLVHFSTPGRHRADIYEVDCGFFADRPTRTIYLRPALALEYDVEASDASGVERPTLWVSVQQVAPGFHVIMPVWRGNHTFWSGMDANTDEGVWRAILKMCLRGGLHLSDWFAYISDCRARNAVGKGRSKGRSKPNEGMVH